MGPLMKHRGKGAVINISCSREYGQFGIDVLCIIPYYIAGTGLYPSNKPSLNAPAASAIIEGAFRCLGRYEVTHAYSIHGVMGFLFTAIFEDPIIGKIVQQMAKRNTKMNGSMLAIQTKTRKRSQEHDAKKERWAEVKEYCDQRMAEYGITA